MKDVRCEIKDRGRLNSLPAAVHMSNVRRGGGSERLRGGGKDVLVFKMLRSSETSLSNELLRFTSCFLFQKDKTMKGSNWSNSQVFYSCIIYTKYKIKTILISITLLFMGVSTSLATQLNCYFLLQLQNNPVRTRTVSSVHLLLSPEDKIVLMKGYFDEYTLIQHKFLCYEATLFL